jgi:aryl-alcohol dehydrogenase-like predicted oxidoreductase
MKTKKLGNSELNISVIGLGAWAMGGSWLYGWGKQDDNDSVAAIRRALELGVNWIDTAAVYGLGHSEEVVAKALKGAGNRPIVATKCGMVWDSKGTVTNSLERNSIRSEAEASLKRLKTDVIDLYQIHWPEPDDRLEEGWSAVSELVKEGKVRYAGVSNCSVEQLERIRKIHPVTSLQPPYNMLRRGIETGILPYCLKNNIGVICYSPMQKGLLTEESLRGKFDSLAADDHRRRDPGIKEPQLGINHRLVGKLRDLSAKYGRTVEQLAIAWVLRSSEVTAAIVGARRPGQIEKTAPAGDFVISKQDIEEIEGFLKERDKELEKIETA